ncbi:RHS repeat-associated core domain-containing protein [Arthrobacter sp. HMWF013]|uniref:RHS repeat-associated core domain-containing protein n=1 Tax=Arthrobacter sp. HMWF013 TaxID=2056849 RepID=UPI002159D967|nr:RHS repeat-associated core domain-containing protein [Arthrobacter sp. HMWF013]
MFDQFTSGTNGSTTTNYTYAGTRNDERLTAGTASFLNGSLGLTQQTKSSGTTSFIRDPDGTLISMRDSGGASHYYTTDALGSVILLTDSAQAKAATYAYDSWGENTGTTGTQASTNPWTYAGGYNDTTSNRIKFGARYYHPARGRFTQPDPSGQEANRYLYAGANPINNTDPLGLATEGAMLFGGIIGGLVGATFGAIVTVAAAPFVTPAASVALGLAVGGCVVGAVAVGATNAYDQQSTSVGAIGAGCAATGATAVIGSAIRNAITS